MRRLKELWFWWRESARRRRIIGLGLFILICGGLLGSIKFAPTFANVDETPLNSAVSFSTSNTGDSDDDSSGPGVALTARQYSSKTQRLVMQFHITGDNDDATEASILPSDLDWYIKTVGQESASYQVVPTTTNHYVLIVDHLDNNFGAIQITVENRDKTVGANGKITKGGSAQLVLKNHPSLDNHNLEKLSAKQYAITAINKEIEKQQQKIKQNKQVIQVAQAAIKTDNQKITMRQKDLKYETDSQRQDTLSGISDIRSDQDTQRTNISEAQKDIEKRQTEIVYMQKKQTAINDGSYQLPKPGKTQIYQK